MIIKLQTGEKLNSRYCF